MEIFAVVGAYFCDECFAGNVVARLLANLSSEVSYIDLDAPLVVPPLVRRPNFFSDKM